MIFKKINTSALKINNFQTFLFLVLILVTISPFLLNQLTNSSINKYEIDPISSEVVIFENSCLSREVANNLYSEYLKELDEIIKNNDENFDSLSEEDEELISKSIDLIKNTNKASTSFLQRNFQIGYNKAARVMEALEQRGVVSQPNHSGKREILINN